MTSFCGPGADQIGLSAVKVQICLNATVNSAVLTSVAEPEPIFFLVGAGAAFFKAAPAASFRQAKKKSLVLVSNMT